MKSEMLHMNKCYRYIIAGAELLEFLFQVPLLFVVFSAPTKTSVWKIFSKPISIIRGDAVIII